MKLVKFFSFIIVLLFVTFLFLINGFETTSLNKIIKDQVENKIQNSQINFKNTTISLGVETFGITVKLNSPEFLYKKNKIDIKSIKANIDLWSALKRENKINSVYLELDKTKISTINLLVKDFDTKSYAVILNKFLDGTLEGFVNIDLKNIENSKFEGVVKNSTIQIYENFPYATINNAELKYKNNILEIQLNSGKLADLDIKQSKITVAGNDLDELSINTRILISGKIDYLTKLKEFKNISGNLIPSGINNLKGDLDINILLDILIDKDLNIKTLKSDSKINTSNGSFDYSFEPNEDKNKIIISNVTTNSNLLDKDLSTTGDFLLNGKLVKFSFNKKIDSKLYQSNFSGSIDTVDFNTFLKNDVINGQIDFNISSNNKQGRNIINAKLNLDNALVKFDDINYKKEPKSNASLDFTLDKKSENINIFSQLSYVAKDSKINLVNLILNKNNEIENFKSINIQTPKNSVSINKNKDNVSIVGDSLDLTKFIQSLTDFSDDSNTISSNFNSKLTAKIKKVYIGKDVINELVFSANLKNGEYESLNGFGSFSNTETASITINKNKKNNIVTTFVSDRSVPFLSGLNFAKGFGNGKLNYISEEDVSVDKTNTKITLSNYYVKEMPILANLLSLTSFTGIIDTLSGKGVFFNKSYLEYEIKNKTLTIIDAYGTGDSLGYTLEGKINPDGFVSLDGNLVPAYLVNDIIRQVPVVGKVITGKQGDGIFGASFKIKGQPDSLETTVNPIRTLTPRFIQRFFDLFRSSSK
ncbi:MAG: hypothetical protein O3B93_01675 [Proteobacteria bacterium]|nr:hypothetical protein [Pseudomonadota bacterium]